MTKFRMTAIAVAGALLGSSAALADTYSCKITPAGTGDWIPEQVIVQHNTANGTVLVNDNIIQSFLGSPVAGKLKSKNSKRVLFAWTVSGVKDNSGNYAAALTYSLNIQLPSGTASITGRPQGYANKWRGSGTCTVR